MPTHTKEVDQADFEALLELFEAVTGISHLTVVSGSTKVRGLSTLIEFETVDLTIGAHPKTQHVFEINPADHVETYREGSRG